MASDDCFDYFLSCPECKWRSALGGWPIVIRGLCHMCGKAELVWVKAS